MNSLIHSFVHSLIGSFLPPCPRDPLLSRNTVTTLTINDLHKSDPSHVTAQTRHKPGLRLDFTMMNAMVGLMKFWDSRFARFALPILIQSMALAVLPMGCRSKMAQAPPPKAPPAPNPPVATSLHTPGGD